MKVSNDRAIEEDRESGSSCAGKVGGLRNTGDGVAVVVCRVLWVLTKWAWLNKN